NQTKTWFLPEDGSIRSKYAESEAKTPGKGLWRLRNADFNKVYYDPSVTYVPWVGVDNSNNEFLDSNPVSAISDPYKTTSAKIDLTSLTTNDMPNADGNVYLAKHYTWTDINSASCPDNVAGVVDGTSPFTDPGGTCTEGALVEIKPASLGGSDTYTKGTNRTDCVGSVCTYAEELQNFANFYSYARTRHYASKTALGQVIAAAENIRIGFGAFGGTNDNIAIAEMNESALAGNKGELLEHIYRNKASSNSTPIRDSLEQTGRYYECLNSRSIIPAPACPVLPAPEGNCQQNFSLVVTAGFWNANGPGNDIGNDDADSASAFDGGRYADNASRTLADVAMYFYERDLHPGLANEVPATEKDLAGAPASAFGGSSALPTMHQHMSTFVISFGVSGSISMDMVPADYSQAFNWGDVLTDDDKLNDLVHTAVNGRGDFLDAGNPTELKAALENAFAQFSQAIGTASAVSFNSQEIQAGSLVFRAFYNIRENTGDLVAQEFDSRGILGAEVWSAAEKLDLKTFDTRQILTFDPTVANGAGGIPFRSSRLNSQQKLALEDDPLGVIVENSAEFNTQIAKHVNYLRGDSRNERPLGNLRERPKVKGRMGDVVSSTPVFYGAPSRLRRNSPPFPTIEPYTRFQNRYAARQEVVYVSSNDGMVHGFRADTGEEIFAYVPDHVITGDYSQRIKQLLSSNYNHRYTVDLGNAINDVYLDPDFRSTTLFRDKEWVTMLVGGMRGGGKGYFALDITNPNNVTESNAAAVVMWEFTDEDDVHPTVAGVPVLDAVGIPVSDLGYSYSVPTIAMSNISDPSDGENEWVAVLGNGYNSTSGKAVLFVLLASKGTDGNWCHPDKAGCLANEYDFVKLETPVVSATVANGLGRPRAIDLDGNGTVDLVYAGDRFGNLYRFDLRDPNPANWDSTRIFEATYHNTATGLDEVQPITTRPYVVVHPTRSTGANCYTFDQDEVKVDSLCGGYIIVFATGSYIYEGDDTSRDIQSIYGVWDRLGSTLVLKSDLVQQEYTSIEDDANVGTVRVLSENPVDYDTRFGWYNDLDHASADGLTDPEFPGEKAIRNIQVRGGIAFVNSVMPKTVLSCLVEAGGAAHAFCPDTGTLLCAGDDGVFDLNDDGYYTAADKTVGGDVVASTFFEDSVPTDSTFIGGKRVTQLGDQTLQIQGTNTSGGNNTGRISWQRVKR
ncbi:MAG: PilC/PilY family type IV pilus protein, partial [Gammaproteobacteria bacterium]|nr:PilC/PilY family type IV pilus protein [Gammaproteobacteria bacterium]